MNWTTELASEDTKKWGKVYRICGEEGDVKAVLVGHHIYYPRNWVLHVNKLRICQVLGFIEGDEDGVAAMAEAERLIAKAKEGL